MTGALVRYKMMKKGGIVSRGRPLARACAKPACNRQSLTSNDFFIGTAKTILIIGFMCGLLLRKAWRLLA
jgi:hypothetical protein